MSVWGHAYPWDVLGDPGFVERVAELGLDGVYLAGAYHTVRAATPWHPDHVLVDAVHAALYRPVRGSVWAEHRLRPSPAPWAGTSDSFGDAVRVLDDAGISVGAWLVLTHNSWLGEPHPDLVVRNCYGDPYTYALCPAHDDVRHYAATLAEAAVAGLPLARVCLEACGQLGFDHGGHHDKTAGAYSERTRRALSVCCCAACSEKWPEDPLPRLRTATRGHPEVFTDELREMLLETRHAAADALRSAVIDAVGPLPVTLHGDPDPWATGALPGLTTAAAASGATITVQCWPLEEESVRRVRATRDAVAGRVAAYVTVLPPVTTGIAEHVRALAAAGADELHLYHLGLAGPDRFGLLREAAQTFRGGSPTSGGA